MDHLTACQSSGQRTDRPRSQSAKRNRCTLSKKRRQGDVPHQVPACRSRATASARNFGDQQNVPPPPNGGSRERRSLEKSTNRRHWRHAGRTPSSCSAFSGHCTLSVKGVQRCCCLLRKTNESLYTCNPLWQAFEATMFFSA